MRYLLFAGEFLYPNAGAYDLVSAFDEDPTEYAKEILGKEIRRGRLEDFEDDSGEFVEWVQVYDIKKKKVILELGQAYSSCETIKKIVDRI